MRHNGSADTGKALSCAKILAYEVALQNVHANALADNRPPLDSMFNNAA